MKGCLQTYVQLTSLTNKICSIKDHSGFLPDTRLVVCDMSKAFDRVLPKCLRRKLENYVVK